jgi:hypothetical protein
LPVHFEGTFCCASLRSLRITASRFERGNNAPLGFYQSVAVLRTMIRSGDTYATHAAMAEAIAVLALAHGIEPYDYRTGE